MSNNELPDDEFMDLDKSTITSKRIIIDDVTGAEYEEEFEAEGTEPSTESIYPPVPLSVQTVRSIFGPPATAPCEAGIVMLPAPVRGVTRIRVHMKLRPLFTHFLQEIADAGYWHLIDDIRGFRVRRRRMANNRIGDRNLSPTSWGIGVTINEGVNGNMRETMRQPWGGPRHIIEKGDPGFGFYEGHPIVLIARDFNLTWAGASTWDDKARKVNSRPDASLFQYCREWAQK